MILEEFKKYADQMGAQLSGILSVSFIGTEHGEVLYNQSFSGLDYTATAKFEAEIRFRRSNILIIYMRILFERLLSQTVNRFM